MAASKTKATRVQAQCVHHWVIESPNGRESVGVCRHCQKERTFQNSNEQVMWEQTNTIRNTNSLRVRRPEPTALADEVD